MPETSRASFTSDAGIVVPGNYSSPITNDLIRDGGGGRGVLPFTP